MLFSDEYQTIAEPAQGQFRDRGSRFIGIAIPVQTEHQVKDALESLRKQYFDATHHCYAYALGPDRSAYRMNDDGEPSGTAGRPIYGQILSADLTNVLIVVIRYYGGTKLGVPGLINAYKTAAREALSAARIANCIVKEVNRLEYEYGAMNEVMRILKDEEADVLHTDFGMKCVIEFALRSREAARVCERLERISNLKISHLKTI